MFITANLLIKTNKNKLETEKELDSIKEIISSMTDDIIKELTESEAYRRIYRYDKDRNVMA